MSREWAGGFLCRCRARVAGAMVAAVLLAVVLPPLPLSAAVSFGPTPLAGWSTNGTVYAVEIHGDTVYLGGRFTAVSAPGGGASQPRVNVAAISLSTGQILPFRADTNNDVRAITTDGATVWIGGLFSTVGGAYQRRVAAVDAVTGARRAAFHPDPSAILYALDYSEAEDALYIGGAFTAVDGVVAERIAKLDPDTGTPDPAFQGRASATVRGVVVDADGGEVWVAGTFTAIAGTTRRYLAALDADTGSAVGPALALVDAPLLAVDVTPDGTTVFGAVAGLQNRAQAWNTSTGARRWFQQAMGDAQAVTYHSGTLYFGFHEGFAGDTRVRLLAADALTGVLDPSFRPVIDSFLGVWALDAAAGGLAAGGTFTTVNSVRTRGVAVFPPLVAVDTTPPSAPGVPHVGTPTATSLTLAWAPALDDVAVTGYRLLRDGVEIATTTVPSFTDTGLAPSTPYSYSVSAFDAAGNAGPSIGAVISTAADVTPPTAPGGLAASDVAADSVSLAWIGAADDVGVSGYEVIRDGAVVATVTATSYVDGGLSPDTGYVYSVRAFDGAGNVGPAAVDVVVTTLGPPDVVAPGAPGTPEVVAIGVTEASLVWAEATDDVGVTGYEVARDDQIVAVTSAPLLVDGGLEPGSSYQYAVRAFDAAGNRGPWSESVVAVTGPDVTAPSVPTDLAVTAVTGVSVDLAWSASVDDVAVAGYRVIRDGTPVGDTAVATFTDNALAPGATFAYQVVAIDAAGNESAPSAPLEVTTPGSDIGLIGAGSVWRYLDNGSNQGTAWRQPGFADAAWASGPAELGYGDGDEATVVASGPVGNFHITTYFRHAFVVASPGAITALELSIRRDDGAVVYLNGVEVVRTNMPTGTIGHLTRAPSGVNGTAERVWHSFAIPASRLVAGTNVVAVEVHQNAPNSSDVTFDLELIANPG
jgi:chitodextrinase